METISFFKEEILSELHKLNCSKSAGPDDLHPKLLYEIRHEITEPLHHIFELSFAESKVPSDWKTATVVPIFKKGDKSSPGNYRPVSLTSIICKLFETIIRKRLVDHLDQNELIFSEQYGFRRSCALQLLNVLEDWTKSLNENNDTDVIYLDFSKAFDSVSHRRLTTKLHAYGIRGLFQHWTVGFLELQNSSCTCW